ncbi:MAG: aspartate aminotransferase family protein [Nitrospina sp.]|jgi:acetylornithine/N-succinyldiaminopimelate aminotransferase|nr:aspartate aminotransferase family protein [Nitrospina sp.]MBT3509824.1 aspartate aminotransferase family protein [Nitrospina sp.]MBT3876200.1 aspartate aminotransferase family protein [Nitrospina sp.]MBT4047331.1 aspartate aminotransferase family protein [Nitrospina sp.]MBT4558696.1 aspartate aminotransferase family protein [Nitrospina sp.]
MNKNIIQLTKKHVAGTYGRYPIALVKGKGSKVWDKSGKQYIDFVSGLAVDNLGHCHPAVVSAIKKQAGKLIHVSNLYHIEPQSQLAEKLTSLSFADKVFFCNSGTEANEAAIKLARKFFFDQGKTQQTEIITMHNSFHGRTLGSLSATAQKKFHTGFKPLLPGFKYVPFNNLPATRKAITKKTCAIMVEPIQGEGGVNIPDPSYLKGLKKICQEHGILLIADEVQTGFGRTGKLFAYEVYKAKPDIMTLAKAMAGGVAIGAMAGTNRVMKSFVPGTHAATFGGNPLACSAALASLQVLTEKNFLSKANETATYFLQRLKEIDNPIIKEARGIGMFLALELQKPGNDIVIDCMKQGFLINCIQQNILRFIPPLIITKKEIDSLVSVLSNSLAKLNNK